MPKKVSKRDSASKPKKKPAVQSVRSRRTQHDGDTPETLPTPNAAAIQRLRALALRESPFSLGPTLAPSELTHRGSVLGAVLRQAKPNPERAAIHRKHLEDLKAEKARQIKEEIEAVLFRLSSEAKRTFDVLAHGRNADDVERLRIANALLETEGLQEEPRIEVLTVLLEEDAQERVIALRQLAKRYNSGQKKDEARWARAKKAWLDAHRRGRPSRAVPDAMEAGNFGKSAVYERVRRENWHAALEVR